MAKSPETYFIEETLSLWLNSLYRGSLIGVPEVGLGDFGIVDFLGVRFTKNSITVFCFELKISKEDFKSDAKKSFVGNYNFYVIPERLYGKIIGLIEKDVGVITVSPKGWITVKRKSPRKNKIPLQKSYVLTRLLFALNREFLKQTEDQLLSRSTDEAPLDVFGKRLAVGDRVEYEGNVLRITKIMHKNESHQIANLISLEDPVHPEKGRIVVGPKELTKKEG